MCFLVWKDKCPAGGTEADNLAQGWSVLRSGELKECVENTVFSFLDTRV